MDKYIYYIYINTDAKKTYVSIKHSGFLWFAHNCHFFDGNKSISPCQEILGTVGTSQVQPEIFRVVSGVPSSNCFYQFVDVW